MTPFFSLIIPCYNVENYVERCVRSILEQPFKDYEVILVDDGAKDHTPQVLDALAADHPCIQVIHQQNGGLSSARNAGLAASRGQYVWFIDSDDWVEPDSLEKLYHACEKKTPDIVKFSYFRAAETKKRVSGVIPEGWYETAQLEGVRRSAYCAAGKYSLSAWSHVYRLSFLRENALSFVSERLVCSEDYLFNLQALEHAACMRVIPDALYVYELREGSLTQTYKPDLVERYAELYRLLMASGANSRRLAARFYVWHLMAGTCIPHIYRHITADHPLQQCRRDVKALLKRNGLKHAVLYSDRKGLPWKKSLLLAAMYLGIEPVFYYLHVVKPVHKGHAG